MFSGIFCNATNGRHVKISHKYSRNGRSILNIEWRFGPPLEPRRCIIAWSIVSRREAFKLQ